MTPEERAEIGRIADDLDRLSLGRSALRLRALLEPTDPERLFPIQDRAGQTTAIPWGLAEVLFPAYGPGQTLERLAERGGFSRGELGMLAADTYSGSADRPRPRLRRMPLLDLYAGAR